MHGTQGEGRGEVASDKMRYRGGGVGIYTLYRQR